MISTPSTKRSCCVACDYSTLSASGRSLISRLNQLQKAIEKIIDFTWDYYISNPWFLKIVHSENQSKGVHYAKSLRLQNINHAHWQLIESLLAEGKKLNIFKPDIDPLQVNINIAALGGYYLINQHTLGQVYHISMVSPQALEARRKVIKETILSWLLVDPSSTARE